MGAITFSPLFRRLPLVACAMLVMLLATAGGVLRTGWSFPYFPVPATVYHGPLMIGGFLGTLISIERAVAMGKAWAYVAPVVSAMAALTLLMGLDVRWGQWAQLSASLLLLAVCIRVVVQLPTAFTWVMGLGAAAWVCGNAVWIKTGIISFAVPSWVAFLVLTIVGERLELSRLLPQTRLRMPTFAAAVALYLGGVVIGLWLRGLGWAVAGLGMIAMAIWLARFDLARRTVRQTGLTRYVAVCLLSGFAMLALCGALAVIYTAIVPMLQGRTWIQFAPGAGLVYDSILHAVLLGFVFAMIFGHAPIIFPAVLSIQMDYRPRFYAHLALLQLSVLLRIICDLAGWWDGRQWAGIINALALLLFLINTLISIRTSPAKSKPRPIRLASL